MRYVHLLLIIFIIAGCSVVSKEARRDADRTVTLPMVQADSHAFAGKKVIWGGFIVSTKNLADKTVVEVLETSLDITDRANRYSKDYSQGRFLVESPGYLDPAVYKEGTTITVAGVIKGVAVQKIGEKDYTYPVLTSLEMHIYRPYEPYYNRPYGPFYMPHPLSRWPDWPD